VKAQRMVCSTVVSENIQSGKTVVKVIGFDMQFLYKAMKKKNELLSLRIPLWGIKEYIPKAYSFGMDVKGLVQAWWTSKMTILLNKKYVHLHKGVKKYISHPHHYIQDS